MTRAMTRAELHEQVAKAVALSVEHARRADLAEAERDELKAAVERVKALARTFIDRVSGDDWGESMAETLAADVARGFLAALDQPATKEDSSSSSPGGAP
jgi:hypothetical protein